LKRASSLAAVSTVAGAVAGAVVGVIGLFVGGKSASPPPEAAVMPWLGPGMAGISGRF
jgi:hypothetical protein